MSKMYCKMPQAECACMVEDGSCHFSGSCAIKVKEKPVAPTSPSFTIERLRELLDWWTKPCHAPAHIQDAIERDIAALIEAEIQRQEAQHG